MEELTGANWTKSGGALGMLGCYYKAKLGNKYYKLSNFDTVYGFYGHESVNEVIVSRLCNILGINCVQYEIEEVQVHIKSCMQLMKSLPLKITKRLETIALFLII